MNKKILSICLCIVILLVSFPSVFATENNNANITDNTIITKENIYEVAEYLGLSHDAVIPIQNNQSYSSAYVTVGELKERINNSMDNENTLCNIIAYPESNVEISTRESGTKTVYYSTQVGGSIGITYSVTGTYYKSGSTKYWKSALGSSITADPTYAPYFNAIDAIHEQTAVVKNSYTSSSTILLSYDYDVGSYLGVEGFAIRYWQVNVKGETNFLGSWYL